MSPSSPLQNQATRSKAFDDGQVISMDDLVITYFVSGTGDTTLPVFIFGMIRRGVKPEINAIATLLILASVIIAALGLWLRSRKTD